MIDPAFRTFSEIVERMLAFNGMLVDEAEGVRSHIYEVGIETPVELDIVRDEHGVLRIGSTPPLYRVDTSIQPSFHRITFTARVHEHPDAH
jgi:hypothetical protein